MCFQVCARTHTRAHVCTHVHTRAHMHTPPLLAASYPQVHGDSADCPAAEAEPCCEPGWSPFSAQRVSLGPGCALMPRSSLFPEEVSLEPSAPRLPPGSFILLFLFSWIIGAGWSTAWRPLPGRAVTGPMWVWKRLLCLCRATVSSGSSWWPMSHTGQARVLVPASSPLGLSSCFLGAIPDTTSTLPPSSALLRPLCPLRPCCAPVSEGGGEGPGGLGSPSGRPCSEIVGTGWPCRIHTLLCCQPCGLWRLTPLCLASLSAREAAVGPPYRSW